MSVVAERIGQARVRKDFFPVLLWMSMDIGADSDEIVLQSVDGLARTLLEGFAKFCRCHG
jgi:hypothetical protein